jgi:Lrp/AsnC family transcriptional regulator
MVLQEDASLSVAEIGDRVGLSSTPCWKRIQRLEADGVNPAPGRAGRPEQDRARYLGLRVGRERRSFRDLASDLRGRGHAELRRVLQKLIGAVPLKNVTSRFAMEKIKSVTALPVPAV